MKQLLSSFLLLLFTLSVGLIPDAAQAQTDAIQDIRTKFATINQMEFQEVLTLENEQFLAQIPDGGGQLTAYYQDGQMYKLVEWIGLSMGQRVTEYYFWEEDLFFVFQLEKGFGFDEEAGAIDYDQLEEVFTGRYYLRDGQIIKILQKGQQQMGSWEGAEADTLLPLIQNSLESLQKSIALARQ